MARGNIVVDYDFAAKRMRLRTRGKEWVVFPSVPLWKALQTAYVLEAARIEIFHRVEDRRKLMRLVELSAYSGKLHVEITIGSQGPTRDVEEGPTTDYNLDSIVR